MIDANTSAAELARRPDADKTKYIDLKKELSDVQALLREMISAAPPPKEYAEMRKILGEVKTLLQAQGDTKSLLQEINVEWKAVTNRVIQNLEDGKKERLDFKTTYTDFLGKEIHLLAGIRDTVRQNDERLLQQVVNMAGYLADIPSLTWWERSKQHAAQLGITLILLATILGAYHLVVFVGRLF
ncbi:MAG: hypothetical protein DDT37_01959 [Firmicutes bacterium]|nr:hypothetical protein [candidate division NPL-UPA2 bacterium]